jgi:hypothetical protein
VCPNQLTCTLRSQCRSQWICIPTPIAQDMYPVRTIQRDIRPHQPFKAYPHPEGLENDRLKANSWHYCTSSPPVARQNLFAPGYHAYSSVSDETISPNRLLPDGIHMDMIEHNHESVKQETFLFPAIIQTVNDYCTIPFLLENALPLDDRTGTEIDSCFLRIDFKFSHFGYGIKVLSDIRGYIALLILRPAYIYWAIKD